MSTPRILAVDASANSTGLAWSVDGPTAPGAATLAVVAATMAIRAPKPRGGHARTLADDLARLQHTADEFDDILRGVAPDVVAIEDYPARIVGGATAAHRIGEIGGALRLACYRAGIPLVAVQLTHIKVYACGSSYHTKSGKPQMLAAAAEQGRYFATDDECDAWWLWAMAMHAYGTPVVNLGTPDEHLQRTRFLNAPAWPTLA